MEIPERDIHRAKGIQNLDEAIEHKSADRLSERPATSQGLKKAITEREATVEDLRTREGILQRIVNNLPVMVGVADASGDVTLVNRQWERTLGWSLEELRNHRHLE